MEDKVALDRQECVVTRKKSTGRGNEFFVILIPIIQFKSRQFSPTKILNKNITVQYMQIRRSVKILSKQATVLFFFILLVYFYIFAGADG